MTRYRMDDGTVVDTNNSTKTWEQETDFNGNNHIGRSTGSQWVDQDLYRSRKGRYYLVTRPRMDGHRDTCEWISKQEATRWLLFNAHEIPDDLKEFEDDVCE